MWHNINREYINLYGYKEYKEMIEKVELDLKIAKTKKLIGGYKISKRKGTVYFYRTDLKVQIAELGIKGLEEMIEIENCYDTRL